MADVLEIPSKKNAIFKVIIKIAAAISLGRSEGIIFTFLAWIRRKGTKNKQARAKRRKARLMGGNSSRVILATTKLAPQIKWAITKAIIAKLKVK